MTTTTQLALTHLVANQGSAEVPINAALNLLDAIVQLTVIDRDLTAPPGSPTEGDRYIVGASATGDWSGHDNEIAVYVNGWVFATPTQGWLAHAVDENNDLRFDGTDWNSVIESQDSITAYAGGGQANAVALVYGVNRITVVASTGDSVKLPPAISGKQCVVWNNTGTAPDVFPQTGEYINALSVNTAEAMGLNQGQTYNAVDGRWLKS